MQGNKYRQREDRIDEKTDIFLIPCLDGYLLYNPLAYKVSLIGSSLVETIKKWYLGNLNYSETLPEEFINSKIFEIPPVGEVFKSLDYEWFPTDLFISLTQKCTLRCDYCYADGGRLDDNDIPFEIVAAGINLIVSNASSKNIIPTVHYIGEGEATASWEHFVKSVNYFEESCSKIGLTGKLLLTTNGVFSSKCIGFISDHFKRITISIDGVASIHNLNRKLPNGKGSFDIIIKNLKNLEKNGVECDIRTTSSRTSLGFLDKFINYISIETNCKSIHVEPTFDYSSAMKRAKRIDIPTPDEFIKSFRQSRKIAAQKGIELYYSGADVRQRFNFCGAYGPKNFVLTTSGYISACVEVLQDWDRRSSFFHYGQWDSLTKTFQIDNSKINFLQKLNVLSINRCNGCFMKFNCAGHCYSRNAVKFGHPYGDDFDSECEIPRELFKDELLISLMKSKISLGDPLDLLDSTVKETFC